MTTVTIYHNPRCTTSRHALAEAEQHGADAQVVQYLKTPLQRAELLELLGILQDPPADLVRKDSYFTEQGLAAEDYTSAEQVADLLAEHPRLMQRPVLVHDGQAIIGRPKERVAQFLTGGRSGD